VVIISVGSTTRGRAGLEMSTQEVDWPWPG
jgi:hypothetical protein